MSNKKESWVEMGTRLLSGNKRVRDANQNGVGASALIPTNLFDPVVYNNNDLNCYVQAPAMNGATVGVRAPNTITSCPDDGMEWMEVLDPKLGTLRNEEDRRCYQGTLKKLEERVLTTSKNGLFKENVTAVHVIVDAELRDNRQDKKGAVFMAISKFLREQAHGTPGHTYTNIGIRRIFQIDSVDDPSSVGYTHENHIWKKMMRYRKVAMAAKEKKTIKPNQATDIFGS